MCLIFLTSSVYQFRHAFCTTLFATGKVLLMLLVKVFHTSENIHMDFSFRLLCYSLCNSILQICLIYLSDVRIVGFCVLLTYCHVFVNEGSGEIRGGSDIRLISI